MPVHRGLLEEPGPRPPGAEDPRRRRSRGAPGPRQQGVGVQPPADGRPPRPRWGGPAPAEPHRGVHPVAGEQRAHRDPAAGRPALHGRPVRGRDPAPRGSPSPHPRSRGGAARRLRPGRPDLAPHPATDEPQRVRQQDAGGPGRASPAAGRGVAGADAGPGPPVGHGD